MVVAAGGGGGDGAGAGGVFAGAGPCACPPQAVKQSANRIERVKEIADCGPLKEAMFIMITADGRTSHAERGQALVPVCPFPSSLPNGRETETKR